METVDTFMGLDTLQGRTDRKKLKLWYKLAAIPGNIYPKKLFNQEWTFMPRRVGRGSVGAGLLITSFQR